MIESSCIYFYFRVIIKIEIIHGGFFLNKIILEGSLFNEPELVYIGEINMSCIKLLLEVERKYDELQKIKRYDYIPVVVCGLKGRQLYQAIKSGDYMIISGRLRTGNYKDEYGNNRCMAEVVAEKIKLV